MMEVSSDYDNQSLLSVRSKHSRTAVRQYIEETLARLIDQVCIAEDEGQPKITIKRRPVDTARIFRISPSTGALESDDAGTEITYTWPGKDAYEAWRFTIALRVLAAISEAFYTGLVISKRDIYYSDPAAFESQQVVDTLIDDFAYTIGVDRADLNVEAAAKGLVTGFYQVTTVTGGCTDARLLTNDCLIPRVQDISRLDVSDVDWILILEKEAVFRRLTRSNFHLRARAGMGLIITGKGYPDLGTRAFVRTIYDSILASQSHNPPPFYALVDNDPDGIAIMSTYKYGSMAHTRENSNLVIPRLQWLGLRTSDIVEDGEEAQNGDELISLTPRDRKKIVAMLWRNPVFAVDGPEPEWRVELQRMMILNVKAETEIRYGRHGGLEGWIDQEMSRRACI
ncbi:meiotic recombination protein spo11 [Aspergillus granulosus]|uniref:DNA topoisomerase (ATP-hydrolyzing) n=1 Tax=Aspergillus granulosus TaxID=176169 RepID=A0ABR4H433_9EURO